jgi:hypothetical protein
MMRTAGLHAVTYENLMGGIVALQCAPAARSPGQSG